MTSLLLTIALPCLVWTAGIETAPTLKEAGIVRICVPPEAADPWRAAGFDVTPLSPADLAAREALPTPGITSSAGVASPTRSPFITANGWRVRRARASARAGAATGAPTGAAVGGRAGAAAGAAAGSAAGAGGTGYAYDVPAGRGPMALAEAFTYGIDAAAKIDPADVPEAGRLLAFLAQLPPRDLPDVADFAVVDDGSPEVGEVMNLLSRRNLLYAIVKAPTARAFALTVKLGTPAFPRADAANPSTLALKVRHKLTDDARSLRVYGSEAVIARLTGDAGHVRLHLVNYGGRVLDGLRVRVRGNYREDAAYAAGTGKIALDGLTQAGGSTEFSVPSMGVYAVIDLVPVTATRN
jgi:hypothetical protein